MRFIHFALFEGTLLSPHFYAVDTVVCLIFGFLGFRATRVAPDDHAIPLAQRPGRVPALGAAHRRNSGKRPSIPGDFSAV